MENRSVLCCCERYLAARWNGYSGVGEARYAFVHLLHMVLVYTLGED
jgi:hypothetical protein